VQFSDSSTGAPAAWNWTFGDGTTSTEKNPVKTYITAGAYTVSLTASNEYGIGSLLSRTNYITVGKGPVASFTANITSGAVPLAVKFNDTSTSNPATWIWNFGDTTTSAQQNLTHIYTTPGTYNVSLTATNGCGSNTKIKTGYIIYYHFSLLDGIIHRARLTSQLSLTLHSGFIN
jgi:PKD repeat protein